MKDFSLNRGLLNIFPFLFILLLSSCERIETGEPFDCKISTEYKINNNLSFTINSINDYRCPADLVCIWAGDVDLHLTIKNRDSVIDTLISLNNPDRNPLKYNNFSWKVLDITPIPRSGVVVSPEDYNIIMVVFKD